MPGSPNAWERYERWNDEIAAVIFSPMAAGMPVYLDLEDDVLTEIGQAAEPESIDAGTALIATVRQTLDLNEGPSKVFRRHLLRLDSWESTDRLDAPPVLALLAALSLAAENMQAADGMAANNYYGRLAELLHLDDHETKLFIDAYRKKQPATDRFVSARLWESLNDWLERLEGNRGLPTAYAVSHTHVGLPLSQALVRSVDRDKFREVFGFNGLAPHSSLPPAEMEELLSYWVDRNPSPVSNNLQAMWLADSTARERIIDVARLCLEAWDGTYEGTLSSTSGGPPRIDAVRVKALVRTFPRHQLDLNIVVPARTDPHDETVDAINTDGEVLGTLPLIPSSSGWLTLANPTDVDTRSLLEGHVALRREGQDAPMRRQPRRLVPLRFDPIAQAFLETERLQLGEDSLVLVRFELAAKVGTLLDKVARPGFNRHDSLPGLPDNWVVFERVQVLSSIPRDELKHQHVDLNVLQPLATSQFGFQGGLKLPGNIAKWSTNVPPELRASSEQGTSIEAHLTCIRPLAQPTPPDQHHQSDGAALVWALDELCLPDGDYHVDLTVDGEAEREALTLRLRTADNPAVITPADVPDEPITHVSAAPAFGLIPTRSHDGFQAAPPPSGPVLDGAFPTCVPGWFTARKGQHPAADPTTHGGHSVHFPAAGDKECFATGAHYMCIETAEKGQPSVEGRCKYCGLVKRYPTRGRKKAKKKAAKRTAVAPQLDTRELPPVHGGNSVDWSIGFDAVCHVGEGAASALARIAAQMDASPLFEDSFVRRLEMLGHVEVQRDPATLRTSSFQVVDPTLYGLASGDIVLGGFRCERLHVALEDFTDSRGIELKVSREVEAPPVVRLRGLEGQIEELLELVSETTRREANHVPDAAVALAAALRPLSEVLAGMPTMVASGAPHVERWDPITARFVSTVDANSVGAYRLRHFTQAYIFRTTSHLEAGAAVLADARAVKYFAALQAGRSLVGYCEDERILYVPLGADLPGLYGRAAVLASGSPPIENVEERILQYHNITPELAGRLNNLLMS